MRCFGGGRSQATSRGGGGGGNPISTPSTPGEICSLITHLSHFRLLIDRKSSAAAAAAEEEEGDWRKRGRDEQSPTSSGTQASSASTTINLTQEYSLAVQSNSYNEIWSNIFHPAPLQEVDDVIARLFHPDRASIQDVLRTARPTHLTSVASRYFDSSERASHLCLSLHHSVDRARSLYAPLADLLDLLPPSLSPAQSDFAFDTLLHFHRLLIDDNPFPSSANLDAFRALQTCFLDLRHQLDLRLRHARRRHRLLRSATRASAACLVASVTGLAVAALAIATHALAVLLAGPALLLPPPPTSDMLAGPRRRLREHMAQLDAAARGAYVLDNDLGTIEQLVARLHATVESDKALVELGVERGRGQRHLIEEVIRHLRCIHPSFIQQLRDLEEHVCLCFAAVNRARSLLLQHINHCNNQPDPCS